MLWQTPRQALLLERPAELLADREDAKEADCEGKEAECGADPGKILTEEHRRKPKGNR
jgi:hypothetical protein